ncbi:MAG: nucleotidyltransferase domain-containing protein [Campylobacterales bacterium]|nr:nucleotidyltransferase domain-containing protein [Campylobacterales bacterium]
MHTKKSILATLKKLKPVYEHEGIVLLGLFGSYAKDEQNDFSDIDVFYHLDYDKFSQHYKDGFSKLLRLEEVRKELANHLKAKVDFVPDKNQAIVAGGLCV